jgi:hypothetical protein
MITGLPMPDAVTVLVSLELLAQLEADWSPPVEVMITRTPGIGSGYEMVARTHTHDGQTSDGYHTFDELYRFRLLYNAALFNQWASLGQYDVHKSRRHCDGKYPFGDPGMFVVVAQLPAGQITNHYPAADWDLFAVPELERADPWDGHDAADAADRLEQLIRSSDD